MEIWLNILYKFGTRNASDFGGFVTTLGVGCLAICMNLSG